MSEYEYYQHRHHNRRKLYVKLAIFFAFLIIVALLVATSLYPGSLTGLITEKVVDEINPNSTIKFNAELTIPNLEISGNFQNVELKGGSESQIIVDNGKLQLNPKTNYIVLKNLTGEISLNKERMTLLDGKSSKIFINGIPIEPKTKNSLKTGIENFIYISLLVEKEVVIKNLAYTASGEVVLNNGKNTFSLENEEINFEDFVGDLKIENGKIFFNGFVKRLNIKGQSGISVSS